MCTLPSIRNRYARRGCGIWIVSSEDRWHRPSDHNPNGSRPAASGQAGLGRAANVRRAIGRDPCQYGGGRPKGRLQTGTSRPIIGGLREVGSAPAPPGLETRELFAACIARLER